MSSVQGPAVPCLERHNDEPQRGARTAQVIGRQDAHKRPVELNMFVQPAAADNDSESPLERQILIECGGKLDEALSMHAIERRGGCLVKSNQSRCGLLCSAADSSSTEPEQESALARQTLRQSSEQEVASDADFPPAESPIEINIWQMCHAKTDEDEKAKSLTDSFSTASMPHGSQGANHPTVRLRARLADTPLHTTSACSCASLTCVDSVQGDHLASVPDEYKRFGEPLSKRTKRGTLQHAGYGTIQATAQP